MNVGFKSLPFETSPLSLVETNCSIWVDINLTNALSDNNKLLDRQEVGLDLC